MRLTLTLAMASSLLLLSGLWPRGSEAEGGAVLVVIVGRQSPVRDVSRAELRKLFMRYSSTLDGRPAIPLNQPASTPVRVLFDGLVLQMSEAEVGRYWVDRRVRGEPEAPRSVASVSMLIRVVAKLPGAVGYVRTKELDGSVRALLVEGKDPSHPSYPLR